MTWVPVYSISNRLLSSIRAIGEVIGEIKARCQSDTLMAAFAREAGALSAHASIATASNPLSLDEVKCLLRGKCTNLGEVEREVLNYYETRQTLFRSVRSGDFELTIDTWEWVLHSVCSGMTRPSSSCEAFHATAIAQQGKHNKLDSGNWFHDDEYVWIQSMELMRFIKRQIGTIDPIILAAIFQRQSALLQFGRYGDGKVIHLLTSTVLGQAGLDLFELISLERYYKHDRGRYSDAISPADDDRALDSSLDFSESLEYFAESILHEFHRVMRYLSKCAFNLKPVLEPNQRQIIDYMQRNGSISQREYSDISLRGRHALKADFENLLKLGLIESKGYGCGQYYVLSEAGC
jgi:Fic family protein